MASLPSNTVASLDGLFKNVYAPNVKMLLPQAVQLQKDIKFSESEKLGGEYHQPVNLAHTHGYTFSDGAGDTFELNYVASGVTKDAKLKSNEIVLRDRLSYGAASRALTGGEAAFVNSTQYVVRNMRTSISKKTEVQMFYGTEGIGQVASVTGQNIVIKASEWAPGIWTGAEGMPIQIFAPGATAASDARAGGVAFSTDSATNGTGYRVTKVDIAAKTITVQGTMTGVAQNDVIFPAGAFKKEMRGLHSILRNTGDLFGIDSSTYSIWKGNEFATTGRLTFNTISNAVDLAIAKGLDEDVTLYISSKAHSDLLFDNELKRQVDASYSATKQVRGSREFGFVGQAGNVRIVPSTFVKEGYAYLVVTSDFKRIGSTDITFNRPGQKDSFFMDLENHAGYELRAYSDQALFCEAPGRQVVISGLTPGV